MRKYFLLGASICLTILLFGQTDTTIYQVVEEMPRFPACEELDTTIQAKQQCAEQVMLKFIHNRIIYPQEAINNNIEGTAVISFIVEKDGSINRPEIIKDLGGGTGAAALQIAKDMKEADFKWIPGKRNGEVVRTKFTLPIRFKIKDPDPYFLSGRDSVYIEFDKALEYEGGSEALQTFLLAELNYPDAGKEDCTMGQIDIQVLIEAGGNVRILDLVDYNELGFDFWYAAIDAATSTYGKWIPAEYDGRKVNSAFDLSLSFIPTNDGCTTEVDSYNNAMEVATEGANLFNEGQKLEGIAKLTQALESYPRDAQLLVLRGQAYLNNDQLDEACMDLSLAKQIALIRTFDSMLPLICK